MSDDEGQVASVSSLRSKFESLGTGEKRSNALSAPETPVPARPAGANGDPFTNPSSSSVRSRASLDVQRPSLDRLTGSNGSSLKPPEVPAERPSGRRRPLSYGHFSSAPPKLPKPTPTLKIDSPQSPGPRSIELSNDQRSPMPHALNSPLPGQTSRSISPNSRRPPPPPVPPARPNKLNGNRHSVILQSGATTPVTAAAPRTDFPTEPSYHTDYPASPTPRSERPKVPPAVPNKRPDMGLTVAGQESNSRRSPFSTPPRSSNNSPEHSDDSRERSVPRRTSIAPVNYPPPPQPPHMLERRYTPTPEKNSWEQKHGRPRPQSQLMVGSPPVPGPRRSFEEPPPVRPRSTYHQESSETTRPSLPPRPPNLIVKQNSLRGRSHSPPQYAQAPPTPHETRPFQPHDTRPPPPPPQPPKSVQQQQPVVVQQTTEFLPPPQRRTPSIVKAKSPVVVNQQPLTAQPTGGYGTPRTALHPTDANRDYEDSDSSGEGPDDGLSEYPDASQANRRKPFFKSGPKEISCRSEVKLFAVCGQYICTASNTTKVWNVSTSECIMSMHHSEGTRITALAFKPSPPGRLEDEGARLWLGTSHGELMEVDIATQRTVDSRGSAHTKKQIVKIHRKGYELWTIDDTGKLQMWLPDPSGVPNLRNTPMTHRITNNFSFSMVVGDQLWVASGKMIYVYEPTLDQRVQFNVTVRPICANKPAGDITCGATLPGDPDKVYFGHSDGKVSIYSRSQLACLDVVSVSLYKINSLAGVGSYLWAGFRTGMMYVYDVQSRPWKVTKDWQAHDHPIAEVVADRSSIWKIDRLQVISLGLDNVVRIWDGMLEEDWLEEEMQKCDVEFCQFRELSALVTTWNAGACKPQDLLKSADDAAFLENLLTSAGSPDILVFGFQELVDLEDKKIQAKSIGSILKKKKKNKEKDVQQDMSHQYRAWQEALTRATQDYMPRDTRYYLLHAANLVGLFTCIFVKETERNFIRGVSASTIKRGLGGLHGNKGALVLRFIIDDSSLCFINCHLAAGQSHTSHRNNDVAAILEASALPAEQNPAARTDIFVGGGDGSMILDHEICILNGDLNYRIDMHRELAIQKIRNNDLEPLLERDQLLCEKKRNPAFRLRAFNEKEITFAPTYKYDVASDQYDTSEKKRSPAWCDRLLYRGIGRIKQCDYRRWEVRTSDHRPVSGLFNLRVKTVDQNLRAGIWERCLKRYEKVKRESVYDAKLDFLVNVYGYDYEQARQTLGKRQRDERDIGEAVQILQQQRTGV